MRLPLVLVGSLLAAGCITPAVDVTPATEGLTLAGVLAWEGRALQAPEGSGRDALEKVGRCVATGECASASAPCEERNCERTPFDVPGETPYAGRLVVGLRWPTDDGTWLALWLEDASGARVAEGRSITLDHNGAALVLEDPAPGRYEIVVAAERAGNTYEAAAWLEPAEPAPTEARELLPDLRTLPPTDLRLSDPPGQFFMNAVVLPTNDLARAMGSRGCSFDEASAGAKRCLRFSNTVANLGEGPLDIVLSIPAGVSYLAGGRFLQRIQVSDGTTREVDAGPADYHIMHGHWHNAGSNLFTVHAYDPATGERGALIGEGKKTGMCFADVGVVEPAWPGLALPEHQGVHCFNPAIDREWSMGLSRGWYDSYTWVLGEQFVDIGDAPDGTYVLCAVANAEGHLAEMDLDNNEGCTTFRLAGDQVETLDPLPYHAERS